MNCRRFEKSIALYVEGDLAGRKARRVGEHLEACRECREFAARLEATQSAVKELRGETVEEAALDGIRARVLERLGAMPAVRPAWSWRLASALAAAVLVAGVFWVATDRSAPPLPRPAVVAPPAPQLAVVPTAPRAVTRVAKRRKPAAPKQARPQTQSEPLLVKLETSDPDVVIYWIVEPKGG